VLSRIAKSACQQQIDQQTLKNTCTRQRTAYSKRKVTKLWEHFPRFSNRKRALCNRKVLFRPQLLIDAKEENVYNGLA
jgi:5'(3')-deoxyribonucleotidase